MHRRRLHGVLLRRLPSRHPALHRAQHAIVDLALQFRCHRQWLNGLRHHRGGFRPIGLDSCTGRAQQRRFDVAAVVQLAIVGLDVEWKKRSACAAQSLIIAEKKSARIRRKREVKRAGKVTLEPVDAVG